MTIFPKRYSANCIQQAVRFEEGSVMIGAGITYHGRTEPERVYV